MKMVKRNQEEPVKKNLKKVNASVWCFTASIILSALFSLGVNKLQADYIYENNQNLFDLTNQTGTTNLNSGDDQLSAAFNLDNSFTFYNNTYDSARMATNGCLHFGLGTGNINYNNYCGDYTPDPLPQYTNTLFPFWTDLIRDNQSKMLAKNFNDKAVFGWYNMREYNRNSDNSFEVVLWNNNTFEFRYGALDIINHDVLIGEQGSTSQYYQYLFHDECSTGTTNVVGTCVNTNWNGTASNTLLENGGSLYGVGSGNSIDCSEPLNNINCNGYEAAYLTQQCNLNALYNMSCPSYWEAYDDQQCDENPQYAPFCAGYSIENSIAYFVDDEFDYGYEEDYNNIEQEEYFQNDEIYLIEVEPLEEWYEEIFEWEEESYEEYVEVWTEPEEIFISLEPRNEFVEIFDVEELISLYEFETIIREEIENDVRHDETDERESFETLEELEEWFEETMDEIQEDDEVFEITESREELLAETEESIEEESNEEKSSVRISALAVVANTIQTARNSVSSSISSSSVTNSSTVSNSGSTGGISTTNSPSISDQVVSATAQNQQVLSMSSDNGNFSSGNVTVTFMPDATGAQNVAIVDVQVQDMQGEIDTAISGVMTASEADQIADTIIANNIKEQQEQAEQEQEETGQYADSTTLVAYLGYVSGFDAYRETKIPQQNTWYEPRTIYTDAVLTDNTQAFYGLAGANIETLGDMINMQPLL